MVTNAGRKRRLIIMFTLTFVYMIAELVVGYRTNTTTLLTDAYHMLSDVIALVIGFISIHLSPKKWEKNTFGWARMEVLGALVNAVFLLALCFTIVMDSIQKLITPEPLREHLVILIVGGGGLLMNLIGLVVFHEHTSKENDSSEPVQRERTSLIQNQNRLTRIIVPQIVPSTIPTDDIKSSASPKTSDGSPVKKQSVDGPNSVKTDSGKLENSDHSAPTVQVNDAKPPHITRTSIKKAKKKKNMNMRSVFLHLLADTANSVVVMIAAGISYAVHLKIGADYNQSAKWKWVDYVDPVMSIIIVALICASTYPLIQETSNILLQTVPSHVSMKVLTEELLAEVKGISGIHEFHVWQLAGDNFYASIHVKCKSLTDYERISSEVKTFFHRRGIYETTIQAELKGDSVIHGVSSDFCLVIPDPDPETQGIQINLTPSLKQQGPIVEPKLNQK